MDVSNLTTNFGDDEGNEVTFNGTVVQALMLMNGNDINSALTSKTKGTVPWAIVYKKTPRGIMDHLYLAALNRPPSGRESSRVLEILRKALRKRTTHLAFGKTFSGRCSTAMSSSLITEPGKPSALPCSTA